MNLTESALDLALQQSIVRLLLCTEDCPQASSCVRVAKFARDVLRDYHSQAQFVVRDDGEREASAIA